jgi:hypothetical protein
MPLQALHSRFYTCGSATGTKTWRSLSQIELRCESVNSWIIQATSLRSIGRRRHPPFRRRPVHQSGRANQERKISMDRHVNGNAQLKFELVEGSELTLVSGGIWDYSNRLGPFLGQMLEDHQDRNYGDPFGVKTIDEAANQALEGWVSIP